MKAVILICLTALAVTPARAHDPYEITSVAYLYSNRIELFMEMEFPTGMTLAGQKPVRDVAVLSQFEAALPRLRELAGGFYEFTAGNNVVLPLATNVELGVEDHIRFRIEFSPTQYRPLRFGARGLGTDANENPYGTSLTVLDMVNQKVLGQTTLFAATPTAEFPPRSVSETDEISTALVETNTPVVSPDIVTPTTLSTSNGAALAIALLTPALKPSWLLLAMQLAVLLLVFLAVFAFFRRRE